MRGSWAVVKRTEAGRGVKNKVQFLARAYGLVVEHGIRIAETRVRFSVGPPYSCTQSFQKLARKT